MKICYLADANSIHAQRWIKYFADKGHEVHLISPKRISSSDINNFNTTNLLNVKVHVLNVLPHVRNITLPIEIAYNALQVKSLLKKIKPEILHAHNVLLCGIVGALSGFHPFVSSAFGSDILVDPKRSVIIKKWIKYALAKSDLITCDADHVKDEMIKLGADGKKIKIIFYGTDTRKFRPEERDNKFRKSLFNSESQIVVSNRRLEPIYDIDTLIDAVPLIIKRHPNTKFIIVGDGSEKDRLMDLAKDLGVLDSIKFVGRVPNVEIPKYIASSDVYVSTSLSDGGIASSTSEAMACGLPVVITDFGVNRAWVEDGINGFIFKPKDSNSLAEKIVYLLKNREVRTKFGLLNRKIIKDRNDYYREMNKMDRIYKLLLSG